jgi:hypothetical protein
MSLAELRNKPILVASVLPADDSVWEAKPAQEVAVSLEEVVDAYLEALTI